MNELIETIRAATSDGASDDQKRAAATACRALAAAFDAQPGQSLGPQMPTSPLAMLGQLDVDQVLDLVITKMRARLGPDGESVAPRGFRPPTIKFPTGGP